jgi:hypothetical protein
MSVIPVVLEDSRHGSDTIMSVVLRSIAEAVPSDNFSGSLKNAASFSPTQRLFATHRASGELMLYTMLRDSESSGYELPGFATGEISKFVWTFLKPCTPPLLVAISSQKRCFKVYQFLKDCFSKGEDVHIHVQAPKQDSKYFLHFQPENAQNDDCNVVEYQIPFSSIFDGLQSHYQALQAIDTIQLLSNDSHGPNILLSINGGKFIIILRVVPNGIIFHSLLKFPSGFTLEDFCEHGSWCFALDTSIARSPIVHVFNSSDGFYHGAIDIAVDDKLPGLSKIAVSSDLATLVCYSSDASDIQALDIDAYFRTQPPKTIPGSVITVNLQRLGDPPVSDDPEDLDSKTILIDAKRVRSERMRYLRWYEEGDMRLWSQNGDPSWKAVLGSENPHWGAFIKEYIPGHWIRLSTGSSVRTIDNVFITPSKIVVVGSAVHSGIEMVVVMVDRKDTAKVSGVELKRRVLVLEEASMVGVYFFDGDKLCALLPDQCNVKSTAMGVLTSGLIIFDKPEIADQLYQLNGWDKKMLKLQSLKLGLKYRQLDVIAPALASLDEEEQFKGAELLVAYTQENNQVVQDELFWSQLLKLAMEFVSSIMRKKSASIVKNPDSYLEITKYSEILTILRNKSQKLRELALQGTATTSSHVTSVGPSSSSNSTQRLTMPQQMAGTTLSSSSSRPQSEKIGIASHGPSSSTTNSLSKDSPLFDTSRRSISSSIKFSSSLDPNRETGQNSVSSSFALSTQLTTPQPSHTSSQSGSLHSASPISFGGDLSQGDTGSNSHLLNTTSLSHDGANSASDNEYGLDSSNSRATQAFEAKLEGLEHKIDSMPEMCVPFDAVHSRWQKLRNIDIVADALLSGQVSTAMAYLHWKQKTESQNLIDVLNPHRATSSPSLQQNSAKIPFGEEDTAFQYMLSMAAHLIYQCVAVGKLSVATTIINNLGEDFGAHMKQIAWFTSIKAIRDLLIPSLLEKGVFDASERETISFAQSLETLYPGTHFYPEGAVDGNDDILLKKDLSHLPVTDLVDYSIDPQFIAECITNQQDLLVALHRPSQMAAEVPTDKHLLLTLRFRLHYLHRVRNSDPTARLRLLLDAKLLSRPDIDLSDPEELEELEITSQPSVASLIAYFASHNDWMRLSAWTTAHLDSVLASIPQGSHGKLSETGEFISDSGAYDAINPVLSAFEAEIAKKSITASTEQVIRSTLAQRNIFLPSDRASFAQLLRLLAQSASLFAPPNSFSALPSEETSAAIDVSELLPHRKVSPMHVYIIKECVDMKLVSLLSAYLNHYELAMEVETIKEMMKLLSDAMASSGGLPSWVNLLLYMRCQETLFDASIINAQITTRSKAPLSVSAMISSNTIKKRPLLALGTLMYAPASLHDCTLAPKTASWHLESVQLSELCSAFPLVHQALFPSSDPSLPKLRSISQSSERLVRPTRSFDLQSSSQDINLHYLLSETSQFQLTPFEPIHTPIPQQFHGEKDPQELSIQLNDSQFDELRFVDFADAAFFLCQAQPFKAYRWLLNHFARERNAAATASMPVTPNAKSRYPSSGGLSRPKPNLRNTATNSIPLHEAPKIMRMVRHVAFQNVFDDSILASCIALLELCEYKSLDLKVDCRAIVRLAEYCLQAPASIYAETSLPLPVQLSVSDIGTLSSDATNQEPLSRSAAVRMSKQEAASYVANLLDSTFVEDVSSQSKLKGQEASPRELLLNLSQLLEIATKQVWDQKLKSLKSQSGWSAASNKDMAQLSEQINIWSLLIFFNTVHKLPLGEAPLSHLAKANDWVSFLFYAQLLGYPADQTFDLCKYFTDAHLRDHMMLCLNQLIPDSNPIVLPPSRPVSPSNPSSDTQSSVNQLLQAALAAGTNIYPGESLLQTAVSSKRALFTVLALCFPDVTIVNCITVWLSIAVPLVGMSESSGASASPVELVLKDLADFTSNLQISIHTNASNRVTRLLKSSSASAFYNSTPSNSQSKTHNLDTLYTMSRFMVVLCAKGLPHLAIRALEVFEPSHPLITFSHAIQAFNQARFNVATSFMSDFFQEIQSAIPGASSSASANSDSLSVTIVPSNSSTSRSNAQQNRTLLLGDFSWIYHLVIEICDTLVKWHMPTTFERREFLKMMSIAYPKKYEGTYREFSLLEKMELLSVFTTAKDGFSVPSSQLILSELVKRSKFDDARQYADFCRLNVHEVTILEAEDLLLRLRNLLSNSRHQSHQRQWSGSMEQDLANERASIWRQISTLLLQRKCRPDVAGTFFLNHAQQLDRFITGESKTASTTTTTFSTSSSVSSPSSSSRGDSTFITTDDEFDEFDATEEEEQMTVGAAAAEQIQLLSLARPWLDGTKNNEVQLSPLDFVGQFVPAGGFDGNPNIWVPQEQLEFILAKILRLSVLAQAESGVTISSAGGAQRRAGGSHPNSSLLAGLGSTGSTSKSGVRKAKTALHQKLTKTDLSNVDPEVVESLIGKVLNQSESFEEAERTASDLGIQSRELRVVKTMIDVATFAKTGLEAKNILERNDSLLSLVTAANPNLSIDFAASSVVDVLSYMSRVPKHAFDCCDRIVARYKVAEHLGLAFDALLDKNPFEVLQFLIQEGAPVLPLAKHYASALCLDKERIALMLAELCYRAICDLDGNVSRLATSSSSSAGMNARGSMGTTDESGFVRSGSFFSPSVTPSSSVSDLSGLLSGPQSSSAASLRVQQASSSTRSLGNVSLSTLPTAPAQPLATFFSNKNWPDYVDLASPKASLVGDEILRLLSISTSKPNFASGAGGGLGGAAIGLGVGSGIAANQVPGTASTSSSIAIQGGAMSSSSSLQQTSQSLASTTANVAYNVEIELIIRAFVGYRVGLDVLKQAKLFELVEQRVPIYVENQQFKALVRLVTGIKLYAQLQYILDILVRYDCFDMLLSRNVYHLEDGDDRKELQLALFNFLKAHYPTHIDKMKLLFLRFSMFREHADLLQERAWMFLNTMKTRLEPNVLLQALDCFLEAASMYVKDMAYGLEAKCLDMANLIQLQFELPDVRIVNLKDSQAQLFLSHCPIFSHSLIVAKAYSLLKQAHWIEAIFMQVVLNSNWTFWSELQAQLPLERGLLFSKLVKRVKQELSSPSATNKTHYNLVIANTRSFLENLEDHYLRLKYARDLGLTDMIDTLSRALGAEYNTTLIIS